ncbi:condensation domain-containing protein [Kutzneria sp. CA-103260]|uniref:condensation domain-containing protein n=1 Tax=Kutzneria sp. CA-103260 TaxID=2802641 RepID=UPI001BF081BE|nr:condensation domain-containing protein [Kutzneria sp. CA-103260]QUQ64653.1 Condensation domain protein [Kutzneria sp. CA-103260]
MADAPRTVPEMVAASFELGDPAAVQVVSGDQSLTVARLDALAWGTAASLRAQGIRPGSVVPVISARGAEQVAAWLAVLRTGAAITTELVGDGPVLSDTGALWLSEGPPLELAPVGPDDPAFVLDGVVVTQEALLNAALTVAWLHDLEPESRLFAATSIPMAEAFGCQFTGAQLVLSGRVGITDAILTPDLIDEIPDGSLRAVSLVWQDVRPGPLPVDECESRWGVAPRGFYAVTGQPGFVAEVTPAGDEPVLVPLPSNHLDVCDDSGEPLPDGVEGVLHVNGAAGLRAVRLRDGAVRLSSPTVDLARPRATSTEISARRAADLFAETLAESGLDGPDQLEALRDQHADFFTLGGHSLLAVRMVAKAAERWGRQVALREFLADPTIAGLGALLDAASSMPETPVSLPDDGWYPATAAQRRLWFLDRIPQLRQGYLVAFPLRYTGPVDVPLLVASIRSVLARHPALRSTFQLDHASRQLRYRTDGPAPEVSLMDADGRTDDEIAKHLRESLWQPFDLAAEPPARATVVTAGATTWVALSASHVVLDGWSLRLIATEIGETYRAGGSPALPAPVHPASMPVPNDDHLDDVLDGLRGAPLDIDLPRDRPRGGMQSTEGDTATLALDPEESARLRAAGAALGCSTFMVLTALLAAGLARRSSQRDFVFAFPWAARDTPGRAEVVGMFAGTLLVRADLTGDPSWTELLGRVRRSTTAALAGGDVSFDAVAAALQPERDLSRPPVTPVLVSVLDDPLQAPDLGPDVDGEVLLWASSHVKYELQVTAVDQGDRLELFADYATGLFDRGTVAALLTELRDCARDLVKDPEATVAQPSPAVPEPADPLTLVHQAWLQVLNVPEVATDVSFFDAGGDSLLLIMLLDKLMPLTDQELTVADLFRYNTVRRQARLLAGEDRGGPALRDGGRQRLLGAARRPARGTGDR